MMCRVTNFILQAHKQEKLGRNFGQKNEDEWAGKVEISKEEIPGSMCSMRDFYLAYSRL